MLEPPTSAQGALTVKASADKLRQAPRLNQNAVADLSESRSRANIYSYYGYPNRRPRSGYAARGTSYGAAPVGGNGGAAGPSGAPGGYSGGRPYYGPDNGYGSGNGAPAAGNAGVAGAGQAANPPQANAGGRNETGSNQGTSVPAQGTQTQPTGQQRELVQNGLVVGRKGVVSALRSPTTSTASAMPSAGVVASNGETVGRVDQVLLDPGIKLISLQQGEAVRDLERSPLGTLVAQPATGKANILTTVELIRQLDLVLTVDTMMAHLAGALGAAVWTMLDSHADWRWMLDRADSPWYPTMRLFRQRRSGDWPLVIDEVVRALRLLHHTPALEQRRARGVACGRRRADMATTKVTTDHQVIREWAQERGGKPAAVRSTHRGKDAGILRLEFPGAPHADDESLEEISWDEWLAKFDDAELALLYEDKTAAGKKSNFNKLVKREAVEGGADR